MVNPMTKEHVRLVGLDGEWGWRYGKHGVIFWHDDDEIASREAHENAEVWGILHCAMRKLERKAMGSCDA